jgi:hypothetical protein
MKAVFRQAQGQRLTGEDSAFRRDSRIEIVLSTAPTNEYLDVWRGLLRDAADPPRECRPSDLDVLPPAEPATDA